jgi:membrane protease YdiL (CAAX protease family)
LSTVHLNGNRKNLNDYPLLSGILITAIFSIILSINLIIRVGDICFDAGFPEILILLTDFSVRFLSGAIAVILIIPFILYFSKKDLSLKDYFKDDIRLTKGVSINVTILVGIISALCFFLICIIVALALGVLNLDFSILFSNPDTGNVGWFIFFYALIPGIWEEMTFRGVILTTIKRKYSEKIAILFSSVLFGLFHFTNLLFQPLEMVIFYFIMSTLYGITWGYMVIKCESVLPSILAHYLIDAFGYAVLTNPMNAGQSIAGTFFIVTTLLYPFITILMVKGLSKSIKIFPHTSVNGKM